LRDRGILQSWIVITYLVILLHIPGFNVLLIIKGKNNGTLEVKLVASTRRWPSATTTLVMVMITRLRFDVITGLNVIARVNMVTRLDVITGLYMLARLGVRRTGLRMRGKRAGFRVRRERTRLRRMGRTPLSSSSNCWLQSALVGSWQVIEIGSNECTQNRSRTIGNAVSK